VQALFSTVSSKLITVLCAGAVASCGGAAAPAGTTPEDAARNVTEERAPAGELLLLRLFSTGKDQAGSERSCEAADPEEAGHGSTTLYRVLGKYKKGRLQIVSACIDPALAGGVILGHGDYQASGPHWMDRRGTARATASLPAEVGAWLALGNLFSSAGPEPRAVVQARGLGTLINKYQDMSKLYDQGSVESYQGSVSRSVVEFMLEGRVTCAAQFKLFSEVAVADTPANRVEARWPGAKGEAALLEKLGLLPAERGRLIWELTRTAAGGRESWQLRIHRASDFDAPGIHSRLIEQSLVCRSAGPLLMKKLKSVSYRTQRDGGLWRVNVQVTTPGQ